MQTIPLLAVPNQSFDLSLDGNLWRIRLVECNACMCADVTLNGSVLFTGMRIAPGTLLIPYQYLQGSGNFALLVDNDELPDWTKFGGTQTLVYIP